MRVSADRCERRPVSESDDERKRKREQASYHQKQNKGDEGGVSVPIKGDSTWLIADAIEGKDVDMIITSGHARQTEWNIGFSFPGGQLRPSAQGN